MAWQALALLELSGDEHVLDIGCGDGRISARIATQMVPRGSVCGTDASASMVAFARQRHGEVLERYMASHEDVAPTVLCYFQTGLALIVGCGGEARAPRSGTAIGQ